MNTTYKMELEMEGSSNEEGNGEKIIENQVSQTSRLIHDLIALIN